MKKLFTTLLASAVVTGAFATMPRTVQGIPYQPKGQTRIAAMSDYPDDPDDLAVPEGQFTFDMIESWSGEGSNRAALVIQWNDPRETNALVFGYRWDGVATGADMIRSVVADHPQLYGLIQYTNVSSPTDPLGGYTINGFGWDLDSDGDIALFDSGKNETHYSENGLFIHPRGYDPEKGGSSDYDYDNWKAVDDDDLWAAGWYLSYWSYWVKGGEGSSFGYSSWGASGRVLEDGCWDGWNFALNMMSSAWKNFKAAPNPIPEGVTTEFKIDGIYYKLTNYASRKVAVSAPFQMTGQTLTAYSGNITIPETITVNGETYKVTEIQANAFEGAAISQLWIPAGVTKIGDYAFLNSTLTQVKLATGAAVPSLGKGAFRGCGNLTAFMLPPATKTIPEELYSGTAISEINFEGVESVGASAFEDCKSLTAVVIPESVKAIDSKSFSGCVGMKSVTVQSTYPPECAADAFGAGTAGSATLTVPMGYKESYAASTGWSAFTKVEEFAMAVKTGDKFVVDGVSYVITSDDPENPTAEVTYHKTEGDKTDNTSIKNANRAGYAGNIVIPATVTYQGKSVKVTSIADKAFYEANAIESVSVPDGINKIPSYAFYDCTALAKVTLPSTLTEIATYAFTYCSALEEIKLPEGFTTLGTRCFQSSGLKSINIPSTITSLPDYCFYGCSLTSLELGDQIKTLGLYCFQNCKNLESIKLPSGLESLPSSVLSNCSSLKTIILPETVASLGSSAFSGCSSMEAIVLPEGLKSMSTGVFQNCSSLKEITLPAQIKTLQNTTFSGCKLLEKVIMSPEISTIGQSSFANCVKLHTIAYHGDNTETTPGVIRLSDNTKSIGQYAFQNCSAITSVVLPEGFTTLGGREIFKQTGITELVIPASVTAMNQNYLCGNNEAVTFYMCGTTPPTVNKFTFAKASGNYTFPVVVPTGYAATFRAATNWNVYTISEPTPGNLAIEDVIVGTYYISGRIGMNYDMELPLQFASANDRLLLDGYTMTVTIEADGIQPIEKKVTLEADGTFTTQITGLKTGTTVAVKAKAEKGQSIYASEAVAAEVEKNTHFTFAVEEYNAHLEEAYNPEVVFNDDTYKLDDLNFSTDNTDLITVNKRTGAVRVKRLEGKAVVKAYVVANPDIYAEMTINAALVNPITDFVLGDGSKEITMTYLDIMALCPVVEPADADIQTYDLEISDPEIATIYSVTAFNPTRKYFELVTHKPGEVDVTFRAQDGSGIAATYHITVKDSDRTEAKNNWQDGTFWLNEDWFGHTNGSINYIEKDGTVRYRAYESQNPYESFGCTSQYAMIYGGMLYVMSKQAADGGDPRRGGGRLVVADALTLKKVAAFDDILDGGDGRACVGVNSRKVYIGTTAGIAIFDPATLEITGKVAGIESGSLYANQLGDMVCAGKYVFAIKQAYGTYVIDTETDAVVATLGRNNDGTVFANPQGVAMTADGMVWIAATSTPNGKATTLYCYDPVDLSLMKSVEMPSHLSITCGWGAWRSTNFFGEQDEVALWFGSGVEASIVSGNSGYYRWDTKSDLADLAPVYVFPKDMPGKDEKTMQAPYASVRYDNRSNQLLIAATHGASSNYRNTWLHFVDCASGEIANTIRLKDYYWFPAIPVFPDKYAPEFDEIDTIELSLESDAEGKKIEIPVTDRDNMDCAIALSVVTPENDNPYAPAKGSEIYEASLEGNVLTVVPLKTGSEELSLRAESNGRETFVSIPVTVADASQGVTSTVTDGGKMSITGRRFHAVGFNGHLMQVFGVGGELAAEFEVTADDYSVNLPLATGTYVIVDCNSSRTLKCLIK